MRRSTENVGPVGSAWSELGGDLESLSHDDVVRRVRALEPYATAARRARIEGVLAQRIGSVTVLLDSLHDPFNGAAIVRSCDVFGVAQLHVVERHEAFVVARSVSRGSEHWVDVVTHRSGKAAAAHLAERGFELVAAHPRGTLLPHELRDSAARVALVLGNEHGGIAPEILDACTKTVRIPMRGFAESLNVGVTNAILLNELTRDRAGDLDERTRTRLLLSGLVRSIPKSLQILDAAGLSAGP